jgi:hypothetical protein
MNRRAFLVSFLVSCAILLGIFVATMLVHYRKLDLPYLAYGTAAIVIVSAVAAVAANLLVRVRSGLAAVLTLCISIGVILVVVMLRS